MAADVIKPALDDLLGRAYDAVDPKPNRACVLPGGNVAWDDCCDGQLYVQLTEVAPYNTSQQGRGASRATAANACGIHLWTATVVLGLIRCAATVDDAGHAPSCETLDDEAGQLIRDMLALQAVILEGPVSPVQRQMPVRWSPLGPQGGCEGGEWTLTMWLPNC